MQLHKAGTPNLIVTMSALYNWMMLVQSKICEMCCICIYRLINTNMYDHVCYNLLVISPTSYQKVSNSAFAATHIATILFSTELLFFDRKNSTCQFVYTEIRKIIDKMKNNSKHFMSYNFSFWHMFDKNVWWF